MAEVKNRPQEPVTGTPLEGGFDRGMWMWVRDTEVMALKIRDELRLAISKLGWAGGGGANIYWAKITGVTDANNYTVSIYNRKDESTAIATGKQCRVFDIVDRLVVNDWIPVQTSTVTDEDYECIQQMGAVG